MVRGIGISILPCGTVMLDDGGTTGLIVDGIDVLDDGAVAGVTGGRGIVLVFVGAVGLGCGVGATVGETVTPVRGFLSSDVGLVPSCDGVVCDFVVLGVGLIQFFSNVFVELLDVGAGLPGIRPGLSKVGLASVPVTCCCCVLS